MRFLYKRLTQESVKQELDSVLEAMCSGRLVLIDLLFLSGILTFFLSPAQAGIMLVSTIFFLIYFACAGLFMIVWIVFAQLNLRR